MSQTPPTPPRRPTGTFGHGEKPADTKSLVQQIMAEQKEQKQVLREAINKSEKRFPLGPVAAGVLLVANLVVWLVFERRRFQGPPVGEGAAHLLLDRQEEGVEDVHLALLEMTPKRVVHVHGGDEAAPEIGRAHV